MELRQLNYFIAISDAKSFTRAAEKLYVSQPALTGQINTLENELGMKLFDRTNKSVQLTPAGEVFYKHPGALRGRKYAQSCTNHSPECAKHTLLCRPSDFFRRSVSGNLQSCPILFPEPAASF